MTKPIRWIHIGSKDTMVDATQDAKVDAMADAMVDQMQ